MPSIKELIKQKKETFIIVGLILLFLIGVAGFYIGFRIEKKSRSEPLPTVSPSPDPLETQETSISPQPTNTPKPTKELLSPSPTPTGRKIQVLEKMTFEGHEIVYSINFPVEGGKIVVESGLGICYGSGSGTFDTDSTAVSGSLTGTCDYYGTKLNATGSFSGNIYLKEGKANGTWEGKTNGHSKNGSWSFTFTPIN